MIAGCGMWDVGSAASNHNPQSSEAALSSTVSASVLSPLCSLPHCVGLMTSSPAPAAAAAAAAVRENGGSGDSKATSFPKKSIRVLLLERISASAVALFEREGFQVECVDKLSEEQLIERLPQYHALGVRSKTQLTPAVLRSASRLLCIGCFCIGTDQTDLDAAAKHGICVFNAPFANTRSVAELVLCEMIALSRQLADRSSECHAGRWNKQSSGCYEVRGKTLCIVGYGHVGSQLSVLAEATGLKVHFYDIVPKLALGLAEAKDSLLDALSGADFVSLHVPATAQTAHLIAAPQIASMKKGAYLINAARGQVVDLEAVAAALRSGHLAGAAIDVFPSEPAAADELFECPLRGLANVLLTPHIGGSTEEAQVAIGQEVASKMVAFINSGASVGSVNLPELSLPPHPTTHRILNIHANVPGVLRDVNHVLAEYNVVAQLLMTMGSVGYLIVDVERGVSAEIKAKIAKLNKSIKTRLLY